jgi:hypothetical protein
MVEEHGIDRHSIKPEIDGSPDGSAGIFDCDAVDGIVLTIQETRQTENTVAVSTSGIATEGNSEQLEHLFLTRKVEAIDPPEHLIFTWRCRKDCGGRWHGIRCPQLSEPGVAVRVDVYI